MSLLKELKSKKPAIEPLPIINDMVYCKPGNEKDFISQLKSSFPELIPLIKSAVDVGLIDGLRNVSYRLNK